MTKIDAEWIADQRAKMEKMRPFAEAYKYQSCERGHLAGCVLELSESLGIALDEIVRLAANVDRWEREEIKQASCCYANEVEAKESKKRLVEVKIEVKKFLENWDEVEPHINGAIAMEANRGRPYAGPFLDLDGLRKILD